MNKFYLPLLIVLLITSCSPKGYEWKTDQFLFTLSDHGSLTALSDPGTGKNYLAPHQAAPLMQMRIGGRYLSPESCQVDQPAGIISRKPEG